MSRSPLERWSRVTIATWSLGSVAICVALFWSLWGGEVTPRLPDARVAPSDALAANARAVEPIRAESFDRRLSPAPPVVAVADVPKDTSRAARIQLLAISHVDGEYVAALYDAVENRVFLVRSGGTVGPVAVTQVNPREVTLAEGTATRTLRLEPPKPRSAGTGGGA